MKTASVVFETTILRSCSGIPGQMLENRPRETGSENTGRIRYGMKLFAKMPCPPVRHAQENSSVTGMFLSWPCMGNAILVT